MKKLILATIIALSLLLIACEDSTGPSESDLTPSVLSLEFTGDTLQNNCEVTVSWILCPEEEFKSYVLYRSETAGIEADSSQAQMLGIFTDQSTDEYTDSELDWASQYFYVLKTIDESDEGVWSNEDSVTTPQSIFPAPSVLSAVIHPESVLLSWTNCSEDDFASYRLYRSDTPDIQADTTFSENIFSSSSASDTIFTDSNVVAGGLYYYALLTLNEAGLPGWSNEEAVAIPDSIPTVQNLQLDASSTGRTVCLSWNPLSTNIEGYVVFFKEVETAGWVMEQIVTANYAEITADCAGYYSVKAFTGDVYSEEFSNTVNSMPSIIEVTYTIFDNWCSPVYHSGFIFGPEYGTTGSAPSSSFHQDIYAYDDSKAEDFRGDLQISFYSGNMGPFGNGNASYFQEPQSGIYGYCDPDGTWYTTSYTLSASDEVVFIEMPFYSGSSAYVKVCSLEIAPDTETEHGTTVSFTYEYQPQYLGLTLFTNGS